MGHLVELPFTPVATSIRLFKEHLNKIIEATTKISHAKVLG